MAAASVRGTLSLSLEELLCWLDFDFGFEVLLDFILDEEARPLRLLRFV